MTEITYPPLDTPKPVTTDVWVVDSGPLSAFGLKLPVRMTVIRLGSGELLLHSPTRFSFALRDALLAIGPIAHLVLPNIAHWMFAKDWQVNLPNVTTWAAPGLRDRAQVKAARLQIERDLSDVAPSAWSAEIDHVLVRGAAGFREVALFHKPSSTLVLADIVQGLEPDKLPPAERLLIRALGGASPEARPPVYLRAAVKLGGRPAQDAAARLIALGPERVIFTHGRWFDTDGTARLRRSLAWLVN